jgi:hypothetical protein
VQNSPNSPTRKQSSPQQATPLLSLYPIMRALPRPWHSQALQCKEQSPLRAVLEGERRLVARGVHGTPPHEGGHVRPTCKCTPAPVTATVGCASEPTRAQHQQSDSLKDSHPLSWSPCDHTLQPKSRTRVFPSPRKFQLHTCPLMTSRMASTTARGRKNRSWLPNASAIPRA